MFIHRVESHALFDSISLCVIIANSVLMMIEDPRSTVQADWIVKLDYVFLGLYTLEMFIKIIGWGFVFNKGAYIWDPWNMLDFAIVLSAYAEFVLPTNEDGGGGASNIKVLRSFRVLRPLRTISGIEGLRIIVLALLNSMALLRDSMMVLGFFFLIFAIAGT